jgi:inner membrane protein
VASVFTHPVVPVALAIAMGRSRVSLPLVAVGMVASVLPDLDVVGFRLGIPYTSDFGHRGFTHSLAFAAVVACLATYGAAWWRASRAVTFGFVFLSCASHGLLDMLTTAGRGVEYFWPFTNHRYFFPTRVIEASTLSFSRFFHVTGGEVLRSEVFWVWLPCLAAALVARSIRRTNAL